MKDQGYMSMYMQYIHDIVYVYLFSHFSLCVRIDDQDLLRPFTTADSLHNLHVYTIHIPGTDNTHMYIQSYTYPQQAHV